MARKVFVAAVVVLACLTPGRAIAAPSLEVYSARAEALGVQPFVNDSSALFPFVDFASPRTSGSIDSAPSSDGLAAVYDPGTITRGAPAIVGVAGGPQLPGYPGVAESRGGQTEDASASGSDDGRAGVARTHSDLDPSTEQIAESSGGAFPSAEAPQLTTDSGRSTTSASVQDGRLVVTAEVFLEGVEGAAGAFSFDSIRAFVRVETNGSDPPKIERVLDVQGQEVNDQPTGVGSGGVVGPTGPVAALPAPPAAEGGGPEVTTVQGEETREPDGTLVVASDSVKVTFRPPGTTAEVSYILGSAAVGVLATSAEVAAEMEEAAAAAPSTPPAGDAIGADPTVLPTDTSGAPSAAAPALDATSGSAPTAPLGVDAGGVVPSVDAGSFPAASAAPDPASSIAAPSSTGTGALGGASTGAAGSLAGTPGTSGTTGRLPAAAAVAARPLPSRLIASRSGSAPLILLYLLWLCVSAALVTAGYRVLQVTRLATAGRPDLFD